MPKYQIEVGRDARVYYTAEIEADDLEAAKANLTRYGYSCPTDTVWKSAGADDFENVETCHIGDADWNILASYLDGDGWMDGNEE